MQILKTTTVGSTPDTSKATTSNGVDSSSTPSDLQEGIRDFFNQADPTTEETAPISDQSIDFLFPTARGNTSSAAPFSPNNVVTVEEYLMEHPEGRFYLDQFIKKMETVRDKILAPNKENLKNSLSQGGMSVSQASLAQSQIADLDAAISKVNGEIEKAQQRQSQQSANYEQELLYMQDIDGDGRIGGPDGLIVAKHPVTGQEVLLDPKTMQPAIDPYTDLKYKPALIDADRVSLLTRAQADYGPAVGTSKRGYDVALQLKAPSSAFLDSLGAQIDFSAGEGFWVEKDLATGKAAYNGDPKEGTSSNYKLKEFTTVTREDGKKMIGQEPPTAEERGKYIFVRTTDLSIRSEAVTYKGQEFDAAGNVYFEYKDKDANIVATFRIEGYVSPNNPLACTGTDYVAATSVGVAVNSGKLADDKPTLHSSRIRPMHIDASELTLTSRILAANPGDPAHPNANFSSEVSNFYKKLGLPPKSYNRTTGEFSGDPQASAIDQERSANAGNDTLMNGFLSTAPKIYGDKESGNLTSNWDPETQKAAEEIANKFKETKSQGIYLSGDRKYDEFKRGILVDGIRGNITGTDYNDIVIVPPPDQDAIKKLLPIGTKDITPDSAAYKTVVDGKGGHNILISKGGDFYGKGVTFFWQTDEGKFKHDEQIMLETNNSPNANNGIFVHIEKGEHQKTININNGDDSDPNAPPSETSKQGQKDDYYYGPNNMEFVTAQNDIPGGIRSHHTRGGASAAGITQSIKNAQDTIDKEVIHQDPLAVTGDPAKITWEYSQFYKDTAKKLDSFFTEYSLFNLKNGTSQSTGDVLK